jgi:protein arginine kinase activator
VTGNVCGKPVTYTITEQQGNKAQTTSCCRDCACLLIQGRNNLAAIKSLSSYVPVVLSGEDFINKVFGFVEQSPIASNDKTCPGCGSTYQAIRNAGRLGCDQCYNTFRDELQPLLDKYQAGNVHNGKSPSLKNVSLRASQERLISLNRAMEEAIRAEDYENAAKYRDMIKQIEDALPRS